MVNDTQPSALYTMAAIASRCHHQGDGSGARHLACMRTMSLVDPGEFVLHGGSVAQRGGTSFCTPM